MKLINANICVLAAKFLRNTEHGITSKKAKYLQAPNFGV